MTNKFELSITFHVSGLNREVIVIEKIKKMVPLIVKIKESRLDLFYFSFYFYFIFDVFFYFLFLEQLGLGVIGHAVT